MRNPKLLILAPLVLFLAWQLVPITTVNIAQYDEAIYLDVARSIQRTGLPIRTIDPEGRLLLDQTPLYPYALSLMTAVFGDDLRLSRLVTVAFALGTIALVFKIAERRRGPLAGLVAASLLAANPFFNLYSYFIRMEVFMCFFLVLATFFLDRYEESLRDRTLVAGSLAITTAVMLKVIAVTYWGAAVLWVAWIAKGSRVRHLLWLIAPTMVGLAIWLGGSLLVPGRFEAMAARWQGAIGLNAATTIDPRGGISATSWLTTISNYILHREMAALAIIALIAYAFTWRRAPRITSLMAGFILVTVAGSLVVNLKEPRHVIGIIPAACLLVGLVFDWEMVWGWVRRRPWRKWVAAAALVAVLWALSPLRLPEPANSGDLAAWWEDELRGRYFYNDPELEPVADAGRYLAGQTDPADLILVVRQGPVAGYYADRHYSLLYTGLFADNMALLQQYDYLVIDRQEFWNQTPEETAKLLEYISENFSVDREFRTDRGAAIVYRRNSSGG